MRPVGPQERRVQLTLEVPIGRITAFSGNEAKIFPARHGTFRWLGWPGFSHSFPGTELSWEKRGRTPF
jgi:hypothetical protein